MSNPKQLKTVLTSLREAISSLDKESGSPSTAITSFCLVLSSELSSRGITVDISSNNNGDNNTNSEWIISLLNSIQTNAGKVSIDDVDDHSSGNYPVPMMAALNAAQGMALAACAEICCPDTIYNNGDESVDKFQLLPVDNNSGVATAYKEAVARCQDVEDGRFYTLLKLVTTLQTTVDTSSSTSSKSKIRQLKLQRIGQIQHELNRMAYASYLHGAVNYAMDQPPMWKRCLDSALLLNSYTSNNDDSPDATTKNTGSELNYKAYFNSQTIQPLNNMIRIAQAKGNEKRVKELSLLLAVGYLGGVHERLEEMKKTKKDNTTSSGEEDGKKIKLSALSMDVLAQQFYIDRTPLPIELEIMTVPSLLEYAAKALSTCGEPTNTEGESWLLYHYIQEQMVHLAEESKIWSEVHRQFCAMLNRKPEEGVASIGAKKKSTSVTSKVTATASSKEEMEKQIRTKVYGEAYDEWKADSLKLESLPALALRDAIVSLSSTTSIPQSMSDIIQDCHQTLIHQMERLEAIAIIVQKKSKRSAKDALSMWEALLAFISPLMGRNNWDVEELCSNITLRSLLETCSEAIIVASWMSEPLVGTTESDISDEMKGISQMLFNSQQCLVACKAGRVEEKRLMDERNKEESVLSSKESQTDLEKKLALRLECAMETSRCRAKIESALDEDDIGPSALTSIARRATLSITSGFKNISECNSSLLSATSSKTLFGTQYLHFLSVWSGLYLSPWPFCNVGQARNVLKQARESLRLGAKYWGRRSSILEQVLLDIGEADLENVLLGGVSDKSDQLYNQALTKLDAQDGGDGSIDDFIRGKLKVQCLTGLARQTLSNGDANVSEIHARSALDLLLLSDSTLPHKDSPALISSYIWNTPVLYQQSHSHLLCSARQLVAEACIQSSRFDDARSFLTDAVKEFPGNFDATFSLASFDLRMQCLGKESDETETRKSLLRAAKMDTSKASPFALLGIWYESKSDKKRAEGCYQKALSLDASHPVAGRGLHRLIELKDLIPYCKKAIEMNSSLNGWAWQAVGQDKANEGDDTTAVICFQQALRCRDVQNPDSDVLGAFYNDTDMVANSQYSEASMTWVELASCYRKMGKYSAALRGFEEAASTGTLPSTALCSWAQCELDLGLYAEAAEKCEQVLARDDCSAELYRMAAYVEAEALLSIARSNIQGGKNGSCRSHLLKAIARLESVGEKNLSYCEIKLLGDLYSFGEALPTYVFETSSSDEKVQDDAHTLPMEVEDKISFIRKGEEAYEKALELAKGIGDSEEDKLFLLAATMTDLGINFLSQARTIAVAIGDGSGGDSKSAVSDLAAKSFRVKDIIMHSINAFNQAIDHSPNNAEAWCGLGTALTFVDPLLSQHAFCRALQIDKSIAEPLSSIAMLYADYDKTDKSAEILDALTQLEDTPLMWIGRGLLLEKTARSWHDSPASREGCFTRASDAYRASLQIVQHPAALLGLSLCCRRTDADVQTANDKTYSSLACRSSNKESSVSMSLHQNSTGGGNVGASMIDGLFRIEEGLEAHDSTAASKIIKEGLEQIGHAKSLLSSNITNDVITPMAECKIDLPSVESLHSKENGNFPTGSLGTPLNHALNEIPEDKSMIPRERSLDRARSAVIFNPDSGEAWLLLAKELAHAASASPNDTTIAETLSSAKAAAHEALSLLQDQLLNASLIAPRRKTVQHEHLVEYSEKSVVSAIPSSRLVSEAMSLVAWLGSMDEEHKTSEHLVQSQTSLLLDPVNTIAATALGLQ